MNFQLLAITPCSFSPAELRSTSAPVREFLYRRYRITS